MNLIRLSLLAPVLIALSACGGNQSCLEPQLYESAQQGEPIKVPEDLDELEARKELKIPEPSPRPPRAESDKCIDSPPAFGSSSEQ